MDPRRKFLLREVAIILGYLGCGALIVVAAVAVWQDRLSLLWYGVVFAACWLLLNALDASSNGRQR